MHSASNPVIQAYLVIELGGSNGGVGNTNGKEVCY